MKQPRSEILRCSVCTPLMNALYVHSWSTHQAFKKFHISDPSHNKEKSVITSCLDTTFYITFNILVAIKF